MEHSKIDLKSLDSYKASALAALKEQIERHFIDLSLISVDDIKKKINIINAYPNLKQLKEISKDSVFILDEKETDIKEAEQVVLNGEFFFEHACAGEATRLGLGTKYFLNLKDMGINKIAETMKNEKITEIKDDDNLSPAEKKKKIEGAAEEFSEEKVKEMCGGDTKDLANISIGTRHMLQLVFDIKRLAEKYKKDPEKVLKKQSLLVILNEATADEIISQFIKYKFFLFEPNKVYFMIQKRFHGIHIKKGRICYNMDNYDSKRLHNHGQMFMQKTHDNSIFYIDIKNNKKKYLSSKEFESLLENHKDMISYNIEDISYLTDSIEWASLAKSLELGKKGYEMVMEIVAQNPHKPQKGGAVFYDSITARNVMIESNRLLGMRIEEIKYLNKNFNHYPNPAKSFRKVKEAGMHMPFNIKGESGKAYIYPCPIQGDINFLVKTAFLMRKELKPIANWKSPATTPPTARAMFEQDKQEGFLAFAKEVLGEI